MPFLPPFADLPPLPFSRDRDARAECGRRPRGAAQQSLRQRRPGPQHGHHGHDVRDAATESERHPGKGAAKCQPTRGRDVLEKGGGARMHFSDKFRSDALFLQLFINSGTFL